MADIFTDIIILTSHHKNYADTILIILDLTLHATHPSTLVHGAD